MYTFKCLDCGEEFDNAKRIKEHIDEHYYQDLYVCPNCGGDNYVESHRCPVCGEWCYTDDEHGLCEDCEQTIREGLNKLLSDLDPKDKDEAIYQIVEVIDTL